MKDIYYLVLDRDGTMIVERNYLDDPSAVELLPQTARGLARLAQAGFAFAVVTNQSGVGRGFFDDNAVHAVHAKLAELLAAHGVRLEGIWHCPHRPDEECACRKPGTALIERASETLGFDLGRTIVVGDKECDLELGDKAGAHTVLVRTGYGKETELMTRVAPDLVVDDLDELADVLLDRDCVLFAQPVRASAESSVDVEREPVTERES